MKHNEVNNLSRLISMGSFARYLSSSFQEAAIGPEVLCHRCRPSPLRKHQRVGSSPLVAHPGALRLSSAVTILLWPGSRSRRPWDETQNVLLAHFQQSVATKRASNAQTFPDPAASLGDRGAWTMCQQSSDLLGQITPRLYHSAATGSIQVSHQALSHLRTDLLRRNLSYWSHGATPFPTSGD